MAEISRAQAREQGVLLDIGDRLYARRMRDGCEEIPRALDALMLEMSSQRTIRLRDRDKYRDTLRLFVLDLFYTHTLNPLGCVGYSRNVNDYKEGCYFASIHLSYRVTMAVTQFLSRNDYADTIKGNHARESDGASSYMSRIRAREKLTALLNGYNVRLIMLSLDFELDKLVLKERNSDGDNASVSFAENAQTERLRRDTKILNNLNTQHAILLARSDKVINEINIRLSSSPDWKKRRHINFSKTSTWRSFVGDFEHGGRYYGGWWQNIPSEYRKYITIDDEPTAELDYSGLHINLLYAKKGLPLPERDVYLIDGIEAGDKKARKVVKKLSLAMINCDSELTAKRAIIDEANRSRNSNDSNRFEIPENVRDLDLVIRKFKELNAPIVEYLCTSIGTVLQYHDSCLANDIMLEFAERGIVALPVHDSFIVKLKHKDLLHETMKESFKRMFGQDINIEPDEIFWDELAHHKTNLGLPDGMVGLSTFTSLAERYPSTYPKEKHSIYYEFLNIYNRSMTE